MTVLETLRTNAIAYLALLCMFCLAVAYQWRISMDTIHYETTLDFYMPFLLDPFTDRIGARDHFQSWERGNRFDPDDRFQLRSGDELLDVNGREFRGMSVYLRELAKSQRYPTPAPPNFQPSPFTVTVRSKDSRIHQVELGVPHCTCGVPTASQAATYWMVPPMFCTLLGFATAFLRPKTTLAWIFLGAMLSLSQLQFWSDWYTGWQLTATPMAWSGWFRMPAIGYRTFVQHAWPAAILLTSAQFFRARRGAYRLAIVVAASFLVSATVEAMLQIEWSEDFRKLVSLYRLQDGYRTELMIASLAGVVGVAWFLNRGLGVTAGAIGLSAMVAQLWNPARVAEGYWYTYADNSHRFVATMPDIHNTPGFIALLFAGGCVLAALVTARRQITGREAASLALCLPLAADVAGSFGAYWYPFGPRPYEFWPWFVLASAAFGLAGLAWSVLRRSIPNAGA